MQKATHQNHKKDGAEKVDLLQWLADDVKTSIKYSLRMQLEEDELVTFLEKEGMAPSDKKDIKQAIEKLLELRKRELARHVADSAQVEKVAFQDDSFLQDVVDNKSQQELNECFALAVMSE